MKRNFLAIVAMVLSGLLLAGCASNKAAYSGDIKDEAPEVVEVGSAGDDSSGASATPSFTEPPKPVDDERQADSLLKNRLIYFEYDKSVVRREFLSTIDAHADFLLRNSDKNLVLAGHADERGSNEYNLALGQRRADAVRDILLSAGVSAIQLESLSFGEELPRVEGQNEAAWQENRRVELRYTDE